MLITLTTDFGTRDWFVGAMKGVISEIAPDARVIDITHEVPPGDLVNGAFALASSSPHFPSGTIHVAVIDPGVGSSRQALAMRTQNAIFIGPDNGILSWAVREQPVEEIRMLNNYSWFLEPVSQTFHGRDVFAPSAAHLAAGACFEEARALLEDFVRLPWPEIEKGDMNIRGEVIYIDHFGNAISNLPASAFPPAILEKGLLATTYGGHTLPLHHCYDDVPCGQPLTILGSSGLLELCLNGGNFAGQTGIGVGSTIDATWGQ